jgi:hypothetical protein
MNPPEHIIAISNVEITEKLRKYLSYLLFGTKDAKYGTIPQPIGIVRDLIVAIRDGFGILKNV